MKINFTKKSIEALPAQERRYNVLDSATAGLGLCAFPSGVKSFYHVRKILGRPERRTLGTFPELSIEMARGKAGDLNSKIANWKVNEYAGASPIAQERSVETFDELVKQYIARRTRPNATDPDKAERAVGYLMAYLVAWKNRPITAISSKDVKNLHAKLGEASGHVTANRVAAFIRRIFHFAQAQEIFSGINPARHIQWFPEASRERYVTADEMPKLLAALDAEKNTDLRDFVLLSLFTGARSGDLLKLRWQDIDLKGNTVTFPHPKMKLAYSVPLVERAAEILRERDRKSDVWVFPSYGATGHRKTPKVAFKLLLKEAKIPTTGEDKLTIHDLRRTYGSWQAAAGVSLPVIGKSLGHVTPAATAIYSRLDLTPVRASVQVSTDAMFATRKKLTVIRQPRKRKSA